MLRMTDRAKQKDLFEMIADRQVSKAIQIAQPKQHKED